MVQKKTSVIAPARRMGAGAVVAIVAMAALAACSEAEGQQSNANGSTTDVGAAQAAVDKLLVEPASIGIDEPLKAAPGKDGKTIVFLSCENALCQVLAGAVGDAAEAAGLKYKNQTIKLADPATLVSGMKDALAMSPKPAGVVFAGIPEAVWGPLLPSFEQAGVPLIPIAVGETSDSPALPAGSLDGPADARAQADAVANFFMADSKGAGHSLIVNVPDVGSLKIVTDQYLSTVKSECSGCEAGTVDVTLAQVGSGGVVPAVVSALQRDPSVKYVVTVQGEFTQGIQAAMKSAGLADVKLLGVNPAEFNQQELLTGEATAFSSLPFNILGWKAVDVALRYAQGMDIAEGDGPLPIQLLTKETVGTPQESIDRPDDYAAQFKKLWNVD